MRCLVLGAGRQGSACAYDLLRRDDVDVVTLADREPGRAARFVPDDARLVKAEADFGDPDAVRDLMASHDIALSAAPYYFNVDLARAAIEAGCHFGDLGGNTAIVREQVAMAEEAKSAGVTLVPDLGLAPGMVDILAVDAIRRLDRPRSVRMYVGGLPQRPEPPLNYQAVYSLEGMLDYATNPSVVLRDGEVSEVEALSEVETIDFGELGELEAFHTAGGASLLPWDYRGKVDELAYKTLRYPGHVVILKAIRDLGLVSEDPIDVDGRSVVPRDVFIACAQPRLVKPGEPDLVVLRVVAEGDRRGAPVTITYDLLDRADEALGVSAMERTTGYTLSIAGLLLGRGIVKERGAAPAYALIPYEPYAEELARRGIEIRRSE